ncbi:hypothetical protein CRG98_047387 [Punica granatum]|uniref:Uncharacterized protein n=1 Tax=Punica granatum TaxID=22663 RepID=A0A2I0HLQ0_PUNGR|nr:hypothetical protein CRG98_047387 [Punica granatum]
MANGGQEPIEDLPLLPSQLDRVSQAHGGRSRGRRHSSAAGEPYDCCSAPATTCTRRGEASTGEEWPRRRKGGEESEGRRKQKGLEIYSSHGRRKTKKKRVLTVRREQRFFSDRCKVHSALSIALSNLIDHGQEHPSKFQVAGLQSMAFVLHGIAIDYDNSPDFLIMYKQMNLSGRREDDGHILIKRKTSPIKFVDF